MLLQKVLFLEVSACSITALMFLSAPRIPLVSTSSNPRNVNAIMDSLVNVV